MFVGLAPCAFSSAAEPGEKTDEHHQNSPQPPAPAAPEAEASTERPEGADTEFALVPFVGGSSDVGYGGGYMASLAELEPGREPFVYRIETSGSITVSKTDGVFRVPYLDVNLRWRFPHVIEDRLGLDLRVSFTRESTLKYYGLGNASTIPPGADPGAPEYEHGRVHPSLKVAWDYRLRPWVFAFGVSYTQNWFEVPPDSQLALDMQSDQAYVRDLLGDAEYHGVPELSVAVAWDTRDDEVSPRRGVYVSQKFDVTPGTFGGSSYRFGRWGSSARVYVPLVPERRRLVLAMRATTDLLIGAAPFYELARYDDTFAIGGSRGVRGIPAQRYYGKIKAFANFELRSELFALNVVGDDWRFGAVAFADVGRLWADYHSHPDLDGTTLGLKSGFGGGLRVAAGTSFVVRYDLAWSPETQRTSSYLAAGHMF
ncbi:MAG TPA: BamA/TamA family outer membrane protein [Polyangiaceae bacterium]|nr:BamA/TamA family outer membrane protein [Polyangiaceae bacterium]